jgi:hypothetical protein
VHRIKGPDGDGPAFPRPAVRHTRNPGPARPYAAAGSAERAHVPVALADRTAARAGRVAAVTGEVCVPPCRAVALC